METFKRNKALWTCPQSEVTDDEYVEFLKALSNGWEKHLEVKCFPTVGDSGFIILSFVPKCTLYDLFEPNKKFNYIKLYVRRIFVMNN
jgi:molecular chaperone HtpG